MVPMPPYPLHGLHDISLLGAQNVVRLITSCAETDQSEESAEIR